MGLSHIAPDPGERYGITFHTVCPSRYKIMCSGFSRNFILSRRTRCFIEMEYGNFGKNRLFPHGYSSRQRNVGRSAVSVDRVFKRSDFFGYPAYGNRWLGGIDIDRYPFG